MKNYSELSRLVTFEDRFGYLSLQGRVGETTFGFDRWINQQFYKSREWLDVREEVIVRDEGCDLGILGYEISGGLLIHHMNPVRLRDIELRDPDLINPEFLITTTQRTHNAIHFGSKSLLPRRLVAREPGDTKLW